MSRGSLGACRSSSSTRPWTARAFTLVELLVVLTIILVLMGMLMPLLTLAKRSSLRTVSLSIMAKTEGALYQYKADYHGYPYQLSYAAEGQPWTNALAYNVGTDIAPADQAAVKADMLTASSPSGYQIINNGGVPASVQAFTDNRNNGASAMDQWGNVEGDEAPQWPQQQGNGNWYWVYDGAPMQTCILLNRLGAERANESLLCGNINACGVIMQARTGPGGLTHNGRDLSQTPLVANPQSSQHPGWAKNYLDGQVEAKYLSGNAILDSYLHPLIYICQVTPGVQCSFATIRNSNVSVWNPIQYGLQPYARGSLTPYYPGTTTPIAGDQWLPDPSNLMHSNMQHWAPPGFELEFELWSAGPDGEMSWWRDDASNRDNIPCEPYNKNIGVMP